jgi:signal transduction histidine kinase
LSRSADATTTPLRVAAPWLGTALALTLAIGAGILLAELLMSPPASELRSLTSYLALSATATVGVGWLLVRAADRLLGLSIHAKSFFGGILAGSVALINVFVTAQLMFISTSHDLKLLIALIAFSGVVTVFFSLWIATNISSRIGLVAAAVRTVAEGDLASRVEISGRDEVARLAQDVNTLANRLLAAENEREAHDREKRDLTTAISHDLRTPLASMRAMVEALDDAVVNDPDEVQRYYGTMRREIERLSRMIDDLFELSRIDSGAVRLDLHPVDLQEIASEVVDAMQAHARLSEIDLTLQPSLDTQIAPMDGARMERAVSNLVRNALEHTPRGGRVDVSVRRDNGWVALTVSDSGSGIDPHDLQRIWERFYRAEKSRRRTDHAAEGDGAGLGLAIVRGIVEAHGGEVDAASRAGQGAVFTIRIPRR